MRENGREGAASGGLEPSRAHALAGLVEYAEGSVVSRTLVDKEQGTLTLFAFEAGQALSEHTTPFDAYVVVLDGRAELVIGGRSIEVEAGQVAVMPAGVPHAVRAPARFKMLLIMIRA
ncbi:MAG: cupin [Planctomycetes bacterium SM23_32]|nr:MAG: cupin [Planctomycetes bacterium SM23_32]